MEKDRHQTESHLSIHDRLKAWLCTEESKENTLQTLLIYFLHCHYLKLGMTFQTISVLWLHQSSINNPLFDFLDVHGPPGLFQNNLKKIRKTNTFKQPASYTIKRYAKWTKPFMFTWAASSQVRFGLSATSLGVSLKT